jgi:hypothetical protein
MRFLKGPARCCGDGLAELRQSDCQCSALGLVGAGGGATVGGFGRRGDEHCTGQGVLLRRLFRAHPSY